MTLIDYTYFDGPVVLTGVNDGNTLAAINATIAKYAPEYLKMVLGTSFAKAFAVGLVTFAGGGFSSAFSNGFNVGGVEQRWKDLRDGVEYEYNGQTLEWMGFINGSKQSPIADYTYYWYQRNNVTKTTGIGEIKLKGENSDATSPNSKCCRAWNEMVYWNYELLNYLRNRKDENGTLVYPEFNQTVVQQNCYATINEFGI